MESLRVAVAVVVGVEELLLINMAAAVVEAPDHFQVAVALAEAVQSMFSDAVHLQVLHKAVLTEQFPAEDKVVLVQVVVVMGGMAAAGHRQERMVQVRLQDQGALREMRYRPLEEAVGV